MLIVTFYLMLCSMLLSLVSCFIYCYAKCHSAECHGPSYYIITSLLLYLYCALVKITINEVLHDRAKVCQHHLVQCQVTDTCTEKMTF
jgi:hypothetical protein